MSKPIACPHCGGRIVNGFDVDQQLFNVVLDDEGGWREGTWQEGVAPSYQATGFHCHTCDSDFLPPVGARGTFDESLDSMDYGSWPDAPKIRRKIFWVGIEDGFIMRLINLLDQPETVTLRERLVDLAVQAGIAGSSEVTIAGLQAIRDELEGS